MVKFVRGLGVPKRPRLHPSLEEKDYDDFVALARKIEVTPAWLAKQAIKIFLEKYGKNPFQMKLDLHMPTAIGDYPHATRKHSSQEHKE